MKKSQKPNLKSIKGPMAELTLEKAMKLSGIEDWTLTPPQQKFLIEATEGLLQKQQPEWFKDNQARLQLELKQVFNEL